MKHLKLFIALLSFSLLAKSQELTSNPETNKIPEENGNDDVKNPQEKFAPLKLGKQENIPKPESTSRDAASLQSGNMASSSTNEKKNQTLPPFSREPISTSRQGRSFTEQKQNGSRNQDEFEEKPKHSASRRSPATDRIPQQIAHQNQDGQDQRQGRRLRDEGRSQNYRQSGDGSTLGRSTYGYQDSEGFRPYSFNYIAESDEGRTSHQQASDANGRVSGSYSMELFDGRKRVVDYNADENGFKARIDTNEPGTSSEEQPADAIFYTTGSRPGTGVPHGTYNRPSGLSGQRNVGNENRRTSNFANSGDRRPSASQPDWGQRSSNSDRNLPAYDRRNPYPQIQPGNNLAGMGQRSGRDRNLQDPSDNVQSDRFSYNNDDGSSASRFGNRNSRVQDDQYQPADHRMNTRTNLRDSAYNYQAQDGQDMYSRPGYDQSSSSPRQQQPNFMRSEGDDMNNIGEFRQSRPSSHQNDPSFRGWFRRSAVSDDRNSDNLARQGNSFENRDPERGNRRNQPLDQSRNTRLQNSPRSESPSYNSGNTLGDRSNLDTFRGISNPYANQPSRQFGSRQGDNARSQFDSEIQTPYSDPRLPQSPTNRDQPQLTSQQNDYNPNIRSGAFGPARMSPDSLRANQRDGSEQPYSGPNQPHSGSRFDDSMPTQGFERTQSQRRDQQPRYNDQTGNNDQIYNIRAQSPQINFQPNGRQNDARSRQDLTAPQRSRPQSPQTNFQTNDRQNDARPDLTAPQRSRPQSNLEPSTQLAQQGGRDQYPRPEFGPNVNNMPGHFQNYGTYWFSSSK